MPVPQSALKAMREFILAKRAAAAAAPEQKMLQGVYRGYAGEGRGPTVYHAGAEFEAPNPGLFTTPEKAAAEQFQRFTGAPKLHSFEAKPRRTGSDEDVYAMARRLGIYNPGVPAGQYLEQGENAIFPEAALMVEELRGMGLDSLRLKDGMGREPSLVALDPEVLRPAPELFATPQRRVADYYAQKRAAQTGERPHVEMLLVDPFAGRQYGHSTMGTGKQEPMTTRARKLKSEDVKESTQLYANGGLVTGITENVDPFRTDAAANPINAHYFADGGQAGDAPGYAEGGEVDLKRAAFGIYPRQRATPSSEATKAAAAKTLPGLAADFLIPHDAVDLGLMLVPGGKVARKAGAALIAGGAAGEAEAGQGSAARRLLQKLSEKYRLHLNDRAEFERLKPGESYPPMTEKQLEEKLNAPRSTRRDLNDETTEPRYAVGGAVGGSDPIPYDAAKIQGLVDSLREEMNG